MPGSRNQSRLRRVVGALTCSAALSAAGAASAAKPPAPPPLQVSYPGDAAMSCDQLYTEVGAMDIIMGNSTDAAAKAQGSARAAELGASVGVNAALYSGALGAVPGLGLFANAAAGMAKSRAAAEQKKQEERRRTAEMRRTMLMGIYAGKGCGAPSAPATPTTVSAAAGAAGVSAAATTVPAATPSAQPR